MGVMVERYWRMKYVVATMLSVVAVLEAVFVTFMYLSLLSKVRQDQEFAHNLERSSARKVLWMSKHQTK